MDQTTKGESETEVKVNSNSRQISFAMLLRMATLLERRVV